MPDRFTAGKPSRLKTQPAQSQAERKITGRNKKQKNPKPTRTPTSGFQVVEGARTLDLRSHNPML